MAKVGESLGACVGCDLVVLFAFVVSRACVVEGPHFPRGAPVPSGVPVYESFFLFSLPLPFAPHDRSPLLGVGNAMPLDIVDDDQHWDMT